MTLRAWITSALLLVLTACGPAVAAGPPTPLPAPDTRARLPDFADLARETPPPLAALEFRTDFSVHSVSYKDFTSGGPPRDGIPPIDNPLFVTSREASTWIQPQEPVVMLTVEGTTRAYPIQILIHHEVVNDEIAGVPVLITFCPLCNTALAFDRRVGEQPLSFSTTGRLRFSNAVLYDRQTESWWQQATGEALVGELTGQRLVPLPAVLTSFEAFLARYPESEVLSRETGYNRRYGENPYLGYDDIDSFPALYDGHPVNGRLPPMARVLTLDIAGDAVAYPYSVLSEAGVANDVVGGHPVVVFWQPDLASPLDAVRIAEGRAVGNLTAFSRQLNGRVLTFIQEEGNIFDQETGSRWDNLGRALDGLFAGQQLRSLPAVTHFWFSWAAFRPDTEIFTAGMKETENEG